MLRTFHNLNLTKGDETDAGEGTQPTLVGPLQVRALFQGCYFFCENSFSSRSDKYDQFWAVNRRLMEGSDTWRHLPVRSDFLQLDKEGGLNQSHLFRVFSGDNCAMTQRLVCPSATLADIKEQFSLPEPSSLIIQVGI